MVKVKLTLRYALVEIQLFHFHAFYHLAVHVSCSLPCSVMTSKKTFILQNTRKTKLEYQNIRFEMGRFSLRNKIQLNRH